MGVAMILVAVLVALVVARWFIAYLRFRRLELAIPGPPSLPLLGNSLAFLGVKADDLLNRLQELLGGRTEMSRLSFGPDPALFLVFVTDPDDIEKVIRSKETQDKGNFYRFVDVLARNGLVTANGATWRAHRKAIQPAFHSDVLNGYEDVFNDECVGGFCGRITDGVSQDVISSLHLASCKSFMRTAMGDAIGTSGKEDDLFPLICELFEVFPPTVSNRFARPWLWPDALFGLSSAGKTLRMLLDKLSGMVTRVISSRRELLKQEKATSEDYVKKSRTLIDMLLAGIDEGLLTDDEIIQEIKIFFGAAVETTVATLGYALKVLSVRQDIQNKMAEEVKMVLEEHEAITSHHLSKLEYTERVLQETLRLLPAIPILGRNVKSEFVLNNKTIPQNTTILINAYGAHRDPRHWEQPLQFDPDRFLPERSVGRHRYAYLPFSLGPRNCIGARYGMRFMKTLMASVVSKYRVDPVNDGFTDPSKFPMTVDIAARMPGGVHVVLNKRAS